MSKANTDHGEAAENLLKRAGIDHAQNSVDRLVEAAKVRAILALSSALNERGGERQDLTERWREPLGALRLTLWDDDLQIQRARDEVEWLCRVLNGETDGSEGPVVMRRMGVEHD